MQADSMRRLLPLHFRLPFVQLQHFPFCPRDLAKVKSDEGFFWVYLWAYGIWTVPFLSTEYK
jgi:hypothetical protein